MLAVEATRHSVSLLILRSASALVFLYHGSAILFGAFGGPGPERFAAYMHAPSIMGYLVGHAQFAGGLAILTGIFFRLGTLSIIIANNGMEYALTELLLAFALLLTGAGEYSLANWLPAPLRKL